MRYPAREMDVKDEVHIVQSCSAEVQSNPGAREMSLPSRGAAEVLKPQRRTLSLCRQIHAASWLWAVTGKAHCLVCSERERMKEWSHVSGEWSDGNFPKPDSALLWNYDFLAVLVVLCDTQVANSHRLGCVTRPGDGNSSFFCELILVPVYGDLAHPWWS